jgi:hypothetical protein
MNPNYQNFQNYLYFRMNQNFPRHQYFLVHPVRLVIPLHHHDQMSQTNQMNLMSRNLYHLNHLTPRNYYHQFH